MAEKKLKKNEKTGNVKMTELEKKLKDLKIEILKQPQKRKNIKIEVARILTQINSLKRKNLTKLEEKK